MVRGIREGFELTGIRGQVRLESDDVAGRKTQAELDAPDFRAELGRLADELRTRFPDEFTYDGYDFPSGWLAAADYIDPRVDPDGPPEAARADGPDEADFTTPEGYDDSPDQGVHRFDGGLPVTIEEFLLARIADDEASAAEYQGETEPGDLDHWTPERIRADCRAKRRIVELHGAWPVLVEKPAEFESVRPEPDQDHSMILRMTQQLGWFTQEQYRRKFGSEPPTAPILRELAAIWSEHPDYDESWKP